MSSKDNLYLLYHFSTQEPQADDSGYKIILLFSETGEISPVDHNDIFPDESLSFKVKEDLIELGKRASQSKKFGNVYLLSANDFNIGIETCHDLSSFREIFKRYGQLIAGENNDGDSNIFSKFF